VSKVLKSFTLFIKRGDMGISFNERKEEERMEGRVEKGKANSIALGIRKPLVEVPHAALGKICILRR